MGISCTHCVMQRTSACTGCVVTHVLGHEPGGVVFDLATERAVRLLAKAGMIPSSRYRRVSRQLRDAQ